MTIIAGLIGIFTGIGLGTGWRAFTVHGGSMEPEFYDGDLIITSHPAGQQVLPGQIIVFTADWASPQYEQRVVHRVAAVGTIDGVPFAYTRGDANEIDDPQPVNLTAKDVHLVRFSISSGAIWLERLTSPYAIGALAALAGAAFMAATAVLVRRKSGIRPLRRLVSGRAS